MFRVFNAVLRAISPLLITGVILSGTPSWAAALIKTVPVGHDPTQVAIDPAAHNVYVVNHTSNTVSVLDPEALTVKKTIAVGTSPTAVAVNPPAGMAYVANSGSGTVSAITGTRSAVNWTVGGTPGNVAVDSSLNEVYVTDTSGNRVVMLDATQGTVLATLTMPARPAAMALNIATHDLFVACAGTSGSVVVIDGSTKQIIHTVNSLPAGATTISVDPVTNVATLESPTANMHTAIDAAHGYAVTEQPAAAGANPVGSAFDPGEELFFQLDSGDGNIFFADGTGIINFGNAYTTMEAGAGAIAIGPSTNQMALAYPAGDFIFLIDLLNPLFPENYHILTAGSNTTGLVFDPLTDKLFVTNAGGNTTSVFDVTPTLAVPSSTGSHGGLDYNFVEANPATGISYAAHNSLYAINEAAAGAGYTGGGGNTAGVTTIPMGSVQTSGVAVNSATNKIYVADGSFFYSVDGVSNIATAITLPTNADMSAVAVDSASNKILAWDSVNSAVYIFNGTNNALLNTIPVTPTSSATLLVDPAKERAYLAGNMTTVIDPVAGTIVTTIPTATQTVTAALNPSDSRLYVVMPARTIYVVDTTQNTVVTSFMLPSPMDTATAIGVNPLTGNYYIGTNREGLDQNHVLVYSGTTNALLFDLSQTDHPEITSAVDIKADVLANRVYVGSANGSSTSAMAIIDGNTSAVSALPASPFEFNAAAVGIDLGTGLVAGTGYNYTTLWFATTDVTGLAAVPISVSISGVRDPFTIATTPIFRTTNAQPSFKITATSRFPQNATALVPVHGFYQVDGWQGKWTAVTLTPSGVTSSARIRLPAQTTGRHILYCYAADGDVATVQAGNSPNSPVISPIGRVVFTVEH
jgi:YVTN family beta-propeller protein